MTQAQPQATQKPAALVTTDWVQANLQNPDIRLIEVDVDTELYEQGHIPGAIGWNWTTDLNDPVNRDIATRDQFERLLSRSGITPDTTLILYGDNNNWFAAFAAWILEYYGHNPNRVKLVDGGRRKWDAEGRELTADVPDVKPTDYAITRVHEELRAKRDDILQAAKTGGIPLVDVRSPDEYTGKVLAPPGMTETAQRGGHIPGARNVPWAQAVQEDGTFKPIPELAELYREAVDEGEAITYCRIGERSSHTWFTLRHLLGLERVRNYDGSWTEYGNLIGAPVRTGTEP